MNVKKILVSQPQPSGNKSPYYDVARRHGVEVVFRPFIKVEGLTTREFRKQRITLPDYTAVIFTARTAVDHYFRLCREMRFAVPDTQKYFCLSETIALYLQKYIVYRKRKIFYSETGAIEDLFPLLNKHHDAKFIMPVSEVHNDAKTRALDTLEGFSYVKSVMYRTVSNDFGDDEKFDYDMLILFTPAGVKSLLSNVPDIAERDVVLGAMGDGTIAAMRDAGLEPRVVMSEEATSMPAAIDRYLSSHNK